MFTLPRNIKVLNLPEQVEKNAEDIADLNQKSEYADTNITNLQSQTASNAAKISTLETNTTSPDGTITTGSLDVKNNATFGKVIVNSADDITDKDGNKIVKNESLEDFKNKFFYNMGIARFAGTTFKDEQLYEDDFSTLWTRITQYANGSKMETFDGLLFDIYPLPDFGSVYSCSDMIQDIPNSEILFGNLTLTQQCNEWFWFSNNLAQKILIGEGKKVIINCPKSYYAFYKCPNLEEIGEFDFSGVTLIINNLITSSPKVKHIHIKHFKVSFDISPSTAFENADLVEIISNLDPVSTPQTLTMGATNLAKLTQDQILVANGKGWTLA